MKEVEVVNLLSECIILNLVSWASANKKNLVMFKSQLKFLPNLQEEEEKEEASTK